MLDRQEWKLVSDLSSVAWAVTVELPWLNLELRRPPIYLPCRMAPFYPAWTAWCRARHRSVTRWQSVSEAGSVRCLASLHQLACKGSGAGGELGAFGGLPPSPFQLNNFLRKSFSCSHSWLNHPSQSSNYLLCRDAREEWASPASRWLPDIFWD